MSDDRIELRSYPYRGGQATLSKTDKYGGCHFLYWSNGDLGHGALVETEGNELADEYDLLSGMDDWIDDKVPVGLAA